MAKQMFDKYDRPTIHRAAAQRKESDKDFIEACIDDYQYERDSLKLQSDDESRDYEKMMDYRSFMSGDYR